MTGYRYVTCTPHALKGSLLPSARARLHMRPQLNRYRTGSLVSRRAYSRAEIDGHAWLAEVCL